MGGGRGSDFLRKICRSTVVEDVESLLQFALFAILVSRSSVLIGFDSCRCRRNDRREPINNARI